MDVRMMDKLKDTLCDELEKVSRKGAISSADLEAIHKLTDSIKNLEKIEMYQTENSERGYSRGGDWNASGSYARDYDNGTSYARRGQHYVRGHYSYGDSRQMLRENMERMMNEGTLNSEQRTALERAMSVI